MEKLSFFPTLYLIVFFNAGPFFSDLKIRLRFGCVTNAILN